VSETFNINSRGDGDPLLHGIRQCQSCPLSETRRYVVLGSGDYPSKYLFIGEGPGRSEDLLGIAFVGEAGKLMDRMLHDARIDKDDCLFTNTVLCHPTDMIGGENREPKPDEVIQCMENVLYIADLAEAKAVVFVGLVAQRYFKKSFPTGVLIQHPAFLLRTGGQHSPYYLKNIHTLEAVRESVQ
jgi:uracil-DNA glycosylase family 4